jgi:hypothetical protein
MAFLKRSTPIGEIEKERDQLLTRKRLLLAQKGTADAALQKALADRRQTMIESDMDAGTQDKARALTIRLRDESEALDDALAAVDAKLANAEGRLLAERERTARDRERELRMNQIAAARDVLDEFRAVSSRLVERLSPLASIGALSAAARVNTEYLTGELAKGIQAAFDEARFYVEGVVGGAAEIRTEAPTPPEPPPSPAIERRSVVCLRPSKWREPDGEIRTTGRLTEAHVPVSIAQRALDLGSAILPNSREHLRLREIDGVDYAFQPEAGCQWLDQPRQPPAQPEIHVAAPSVHSGIAGPSVAYEGAGAPIVGTATAHRAR